MQFLQNDQRGMAQDIGWLDVLPGIRRRTSMVLSDLQSYTSLNVLLDRAGPGDILDFHRGSYSHYALYLGKGKVMNICAEDKNTNAAKIRIMSIREVCLDSTVRVNNHDGVAIDYFKVPPRSVQEILKAARSYENKIVPYEFKFRNCEYYCTLWRYGKGFSTQVANPVMTSTGAILDVVCDPSLWANPISFGASLLLYGTEQLFQRGVYGTYLLWSLKHDD